MIKVETIREDGKLVVFFEASKPEEQDLLDELNEALSSSRPKRGAYLMGAPNLTLKLEIKNED